MTETGKVILLGDEGVGKTTLITRYLKRKPVDKYGMKTVWINASAKEMILDRRRISMQIWDTPGGEQSTEWLSVLCYGRIDCCILVCDIHNLDSFHSLPRWKNDLLQQISFSRPRSPRPPGSIPFIVLANKVDSTDIRTPRAVSYYDVANWCEEQGMEFFETTFREYFYVEKAFESAARHCLRDIPSSTSKSTPECPHPLQKRCVDVLTRFNVTDFTLISSDGRVFPVHRNLLLAESEYFTAMLTHNFQEKRAGKCSLTLYDVSGADLEVILAFIYCGETKRVVELAELLLPIADKYCFLKLREFCVDDLLERMEVGNAAGLLILADTYHIAEIKRAVLGFLTEGNFPGFAKADGFKELLAYGLALYSEVCAYYTRLISCEVFRVYC